MSVFFQLVMAELALPAALLLAISFLKKRIIYAVFYAAMLLILIWHIVNFISSEKYGIFLTPDFLIMIADNLNHTAFKAFFGTVYPLYFFIFAVIFFGAAWAAAFFTDKIRTKYSISVKKMVYIRLAMALFLLSALACHKRGGEFRTDEYPRSLDIIIHFCKLAFQSDNDMPDKNIFPYRIPDRKLNAHNEKIVFKKIIIIAAESLNYSFIHCVNKAQIPENATPFIDSLMQKHISFSNYFTSSAPTVNGLHALIASRFSYYKDKKMKIPSIVSLLNENGYETRYFSGVSGTYSDYRNVCKNKYKFAHPAFMEDMQFTYLDFPGKKVKNTVWGRPDDVLFNFVLATLKAEKSDKFFYLISTIDIHNPHISTGRYSQFAKNKSSLINAVACYDRTLQDFIEAVMRSEIWDKDTLIILTADHSISHGENLNGSANFFKPQRIPLVLIEKEKRLANVFNANVYCSAIDLPVTLMNLLGIKVPETFYGRDFRDCGDKTVSIDDTKIYIHSENGVKTYPLNDAALEKALK